MRKLTGVLLAGAMAVSLAACGQAEEKSNTSKKGGGRTDKGADTGECDDQIL